MLHRWSETWFGLPAYSAMYISQKKFSQLLPCDSYWLAGFNWFQPAENKVRLIFLFNTQSVLQWIFKCKHCILLNRNFPVYFVLKTDAETHSFPPEWRDLDKVWLWLQSTAAEWEIERGVIFPAEPACSFLANFNLAVQRAQAENNVRKLWRERGVCGGTLVSLF